MKIGIAGATRMSQYLLSISPPEKRINVKRLPYLSISVISNTARPKSGRAQDALRHTAVSGQKTWRQPVNEQANLLVRENKFR
jgi:hypothetical protein